MAELRTAHTAWLRVEELRAIRDLLDEAFEDEIRDTDYEHSLGGIHALVWEGDQLVGHGSVVIGGCSIASGRCAPDTWRAWLCIPAGAAGHATQMMAALESSNPRRVRARGPGRH